MDSQSAVAKRAAGSPKPAVFRAKLLNLYVAHLFRVRHLGVELAFDLKFDDINLKSNDPRNIRAAPRCHRPQISNRDTLRLETAVTQRKQTTGRISNRDKNAVLQNTIRTANELDRRLFGANDHRNLIGNQIIRSGGNP
jgi:hypothetical protein